MHPTGCQGDEAFDLQCLEAGIAVDLEDAAKALKMASWPGRRAIRRIEEHHGRWGGIPVGPVVTGIAPQPAGLGP